MQKKYIVRLTGAERDVLNRLLTQRRVSSQKVCRARVLLKADVTANNDDDKALLKRFSLFGPPGIIFFDAAGREVKGLRVIGFQPAERFSANLDRVARQQ